VRVVLRPAAFHLLMNTATTPAPHPDFSAWKAPAVSSSFRAQVWQRIEARRPAPRWSGAWWAARVSYAGALAASAMLWLLVLHATPSRPGDAAFAADHPDSLTRAFARTLQGR